MGFRARFKSFTLRLIRTTTAVLLAIGLFLTYVLAFAATRGFMEVFHRRLLRPRRNPRSTWVAAADYRPDPDEALRQS